MPEESTYPRVLVVNGMPFNRTNNGGIVMSQLFSGWPKARLREILYSNIRPGFDVCGQYWNLSKTGVLLGALGRAPGRAVCEVVDSGMPIETRSTYENRPAIERRFTWLSPQVRVPLGEAIFRLPSVLSGPLCKWVEEFRPDVLFSFVDSGVILRMVARAAQRWKLNVVAYFTDDWISTIYKGYAAGPLLRRSMMRNLDQCLTASPIRLTPNDAMAREYRQRFGGRFEAMYNAETFRTYIPPGERSIVRFVFTGTLAPRRWSSLRKIGQALDLLADEDLQGELVIYTPPGEMDAIPEQDIPRSVKRGGTAAPVDISRIQTDADVLVHVESFDAISRAYTRLSLSTKLSQYFMAGRPVLAMGPAEAASIEHVSQAGAGVSVTDDALDRVEAALRPLLSDEALRRALGKKAHETAIELHDESRQRQQFREFLCAACHG
jgi:glycosyltransferase involved in cell wall biosynthesis